MNRQETLLYFARKNLGKPYKYGAQPSEAPCHFDCSSFIQYLYKQIGIQLPRTALDQASAGRTVLLHKHELEIGDLFFIKGKWGHYNPLFPEGIGHVGMYIGNEKILSAKHQTIKNQEVGCVREDDLAEFLKMNDLVVIKRILNRKLVNLSPIQAARKYDKCDVIIILAGGILDDGGLPDSVRKRVQTGVSLYKQERAPLLLMSGRWSKYRERHLPPMTEAESMARSAQLMGVSQTAIIKEDQSNTTESNILHIKNRFLEQHGWKKILVVTSDFHMPRAKFLFKTILGSEYEIEFSETETTASSIKRLKWKLQEMIALLAAKAKHGALYSHLFTQHSFKRYE